MSKTQGEEQLSASQKHLKHNEVQNNTQKVRVVTELGQPAGEYHPQYHRRGI